MIPLSDTKTSGHFPIQTIALILFTAWMFFLQLGSSGDTFTLRYALTPAAIDLNNSNTWLPFLSAIFLHGGILHILSNMLFLWVFGDNIEERLGILYVPFYLTGGIVANLAQYLVHPLSPIPIVGASGAVAAILGAYLILYPHHRVRTLVPIVFFLTILDLPAFLLLAYWFILQVFSGISSIGEVVNAQGGVAYFAHIAGFVFGMLIGLTARR